MKTRRDVLKGLSAGSLAALAGPAPKLLGEGIQRRLSEPRADAVILLWMAGGMAHTETFDPKRHTPFEPGVEAKRVLSTFPAIPTAVDGVRISEGLENVPRSRIAARWSARTCSATSGSSCTRATSTIGTPAMSRR